MKKILLYSVLFLSILVLISAGNPEFDRDTIKTSQGELKIVFIGHGTLMFKFNDQVIHVDPVSRMADYSLLPKADLILITHHHGDHLDPGAIKQITKQNTKIIGPKQCLLEIYKKIVITMKKLDAMKNGEQKTCMNHNIKAVPMYNIKHKRKNGDPYHKKSEGNGYIVTFGNKRVYIAGDTENTPEMKALEDIDVAFLPMNLPYTMTPEMVADAAKSFRPHILYPYHYGKTDTSKLVKLLKDEKDIDVRIKDVYPSRKQE